MTVFEDAWTLREDLHHDPETDAYRLFDGRWEGAPGWTVDRYGEVALIQSFGGAEPQPFIIDAYSAHGLSIVFRDRGARADAELVHGAWPAGDEHLPRPGRFVVREGGLRFGVDLLHGTNTGLFLDARPLREWVRQNSAGRSVLNLFSYTSAFGVAARVGQARTVANVDSVSSALDRGRINISLNGLEADPRSHQRADVFEALRQGRKRDRTWDAVICDPPPVRTQGGKKGFDPRRDMARVLRQSWERVAIGGWMLAVSAVPGRDRFEAVLPDAEWMGLDRGSDFPGPREGGMRAYAAHRNA